MIKMMSPAMRVNHVCGHALVLERPNHPSTVAMMPGVPMNTKPNVIIFAGSEMLLVSTTPQIRASNIMTVTFNIPRGIQR